MQPTGNPLDLAVEGQGFFQIQTADGVRFTRDGSFHRSQAGTLVTAEGRAGAFGCGQADPDSAGRGFGGSRRRGVGGGRRGGHGGSLHVSRGVQLTPEGANRYVAPQDAVPQASKDAAVHQGALESANEDAIQGTLDLIVMQRQAEMMQKALTVFHTEFNKFASEDLPRV